MKTLIFYLVGAIFLFASCQSDLIESDDAFLDEASKSPNAKKVEKEMTIMSYQGDIWVAPFEVDCTYPVPPGNIPLQFNQKGSGIASHLGQYTFMNTACIGEFGLENFKGVMTAANGDEIYYDSPLIACDETPFPPCLGEDEYATFTYTISGGTGRFEEATGTITIRGIFVDEGPFEATGSAVITY